ncbi:MAG: hypothetical protein R2788_26810 [Saprospiraceae bacterium]
MRGQPAIPTIQGNLTISGGGINNPGPLSNLEEVTGMVTIFTNYALTSLNGLDNLANVGYASISTFG